MEAQENFEDFRNSLPQEPDSVKIGHTDSKIFYGYMKDISEIKDIIAFISKNKYNLYQ